MNYSVPRLLLDVLPVVRSLIRRTGKTAFGDIMKTRTFQVTLLALILVSACNKEEFYGVSVEVQGADAACVAGTDIQSCEAISGCQAALEDVDGADPIFASCIANPSEEVVVSPPEPSEPSQPSGPSVPEPAEEDKVPTIPEAYADNCESLDDKYLIIKKYTTKEGAVQTSKKVKVCHRACPKKGPHTIIIACSALKSHVKHHEDEIGACPVE